MISVLKFGGTSVATRDQREIAFSRIADALKGENSAVAVVSAMGRTPEPYATDSLLALVGGRTGSSNGDLLLSAGELIAAAVFADELSASGTPAVALTGAQAGIITDERHGDARILRVEPHAVLRLLDRDIVPVIAGFQGATQDGTITTLGRGGTDLTAIAIGHALGAGVDIYTDVSGAMTADPRRIPEARTIDRASLAEMTELAQAGAKVMHHKAADYADRTGTHYTIKGLLTNRGTAVVADTFDHHRPVTGVASTGRLTWVRVIRGDIESPERRMETELEMFRRVAEAAISIDQVTINQAGVAFVVEGERGSEIRRLLGDLNLAVRVREGCSKLSVVGAGMRDTPGVVHQVVDALSRVNVEIIHCTDSNVTISVLVPAGDVARAERAVHEQFKLDAGDPVQ